MNLPPSDADRYVECGDCSHFPAYHDGDGGQKNTPRPCRAWNPDNDDTMCACKGWKDKPAPTPTIVMSCEHGDIRMEP